MRSIPAWSGVVSLAAALAFTLPSSAQQAAAASAQQPAKQAAKQTSDSFRWIDFHAQQDQNIVVWVTRSLAVEDWTSLREIGVMYDAALVVTTDRANPQATPGEGSFSVWSVSLTSHAVVPLVKGVNLRWFDRVRFADDTAQEWPVLYANCRDCAPNTYFTAFYYDVRSHVWGARWIRGGQGLPVWNANPPSSVQWTQVYAVMSEGEGHVALYTWNHFDHGKDRDSEDFIYRYDLDPFSDLERTVAITGGQQEPVELQMCRGDGAVQGLERGQDSALCQQLLKRRGTRIPVTTPPANNHGKSAAGGARR
jgi:hypothetical protein